MGNTEIVNALLAIGHSVEGYTHRSLVEIAVENGDRTIFKLCYHMEPP
jgi:hypothetical protein